MRAKSLFYVMPEGVNMTDQPSQTPLTQEQIKRIREDRRALPVAVRNALCDMALALSAARRDAEEVYKLGFIDGITAYAWHKDGKQWVGTTGTTRLEAISYVTETWNYNPQAAIADAAKGGK